MFGYCLTKNIRVMKKKLLSLALVVIFVSGMAIAQNPPKKETKKVHKTEAKADTTKKVAHHKKVTPKK
jgi:hypothetical protein